MKALPLVSLQQAEDEWIQGTIDCLDAESREALRVRFERMRDAEEFRSEKAEIRTAEKPQPVLAEEMPFSLDDFSKRHFALNDRVDAQLKLAASRPMCVDGRDGRPPVLRNGTDSTDGTSVTHAPVAQRRRRTKQSVLRTSDFMKTEKPVVDRKQLGSRFRDARKQAGWSVAKLAVAMGCKTKQVSNLESLGNGKKFAEQVAEFLQISAIWLETGEGRPWRHHMLPPTPPARAKKETAVGPSKEDKWIGCGVLNVENGVTCYLTSGHDGPHQSASCVWNGNGTSVTHEDELPPVEIPARALIPHADVHPVTLTAACAILQHAAEALEEAQETFARAFARVSQLHEGGVPA